MISPSTNQALTFATSHFLSTLNFRDFLAQQKTDRLSEAPIMAIAQYLHQELKSLDQNLVGLSSTPPQTIPEARDFFTTLQPHSYHPSLAPIFNKNIAEALNVSVSEAPGVEAIDTLGRKSSTVLGYLGARLIREFPKSPPPPAHLVTDPAAVRKLVEEKVVYEAIPSHIETAERRASYERFHAADLEWSEAAYDRVMAVLPQEIQDKLSGLYAQALEANEDYRELFFASPSSTQENSFEREYKLWQEALPLHLKIENIELEWQLTVYDNVFLKFKDRATSQECDEFTVARNAYKSLTENYIAYNQTMIGGDKNARENERKKREEKSFNALWNLHEAAQKILKKWDIQIPITTFLSRTQAYRIDQGPTGMQSLELLYELTSHPRHLISDLRNGKLTQQEYDHQIANRWALPMLVNAYSGIRIIGSESDKDFMFRHRVPEGIENILGADLLFSGHDQQRQPSQGNISAWDHTGAFDYCGIIGSLYLFGLEPDSIIAEKIFNFVPVMRGHLLNTTGGFLSRKDPSAIYEIMKTNIKRGRSNALFDSGTRISSFPFPSPYAPLRRKGALFVPNEYIPRRNIAGMHVRDDKIPDAERIMMANNFHVGAVPSPDIPRDLTGFRSPHNMFGYSPLGVRPAFAALVKHFKPDDLAEAKHPDAFRARQMRVALLRAETTRIGFAADAGPFPRPNGR
ncbi:MAG: hypothetical protein IPJ69_12305 [Deltaproteobacteria bacterium]|nr:MAG: hypothetical protein IPJ69_12305 [Deltaproteobacteria bacterium]